MITEAELIAIGFKWKTRLGYKVLLLPLGLSPISGGDQWIERSGIVDDLFEIHRSINDEAEHGVESYVEFEPRTFEDLKIIIHCFKVGNNGQDS